MLTALWPDVALAGILKPVRKGREREEGGGRGGVWRKRKREMGREIEREKSKRGRREERRREGEGCKEELVYYHSTCTYSYQVQVVTHPCGHSHIALDQ